MARSKQQHKGVQNKLMNSYSSTFMLGKEVHVPDKVGKTSGRTEGGTPTYTAAITATTTITTTVVWKIDMCESELKGRIGKGRERKGEERN